MALSHVGKGVSGVTFRLSLTATVIVPSNAAILIALDQSAPQSLSSNAVIFSSPSSGAAATASVVGGTITVQLASGTFSVGQPITLLLPGTLTNAATVQPYRIISVSIAETSGCILAFNNSVGFRPVVDSSLGNPEVILSDWTAGGIGVSMSFWFTPSVDIPVNSSVLITLSGSSPQSISSNKVVFVFPSLGLPSASASLFNSGVLSVFLHSGSFLSGQNISFKLPGTVTNAANPQNARTDIAMAVMDNSGAVLCKSLTGIMHPIVDGRLNVAINLDWRSSGATSASLFASITPFCDILPGSSIIISLMGSSPQSLSSNAVNFHSPGHELLTATASVSSGVLVVDLLSSTFSSGQLILFKLSGTLTNPATSQPSLNNVSVSVVNNISVIRSINRSIFFDAIHDSATMFAHALTGYTVSSIGLRTFGSLKIQGASAGNVLLFNYPPELFASSRCAVFLFV